jgi:hypothetical protein
VDVEGSWLRPCGVTSDTRTGNYRMSTLIHRLLFYSPSTGTSMVFIYWFRMYEDALEAFQTCLVLCGNHGSGGGLGVAGGVSGVGSSGSSLCVGALVSLALVYLVKGQTDEAILHLHHVCTPISFFVYIRVDWNLFVFLGGCLGACYRSRRRSWERVVKELYGSYCSASIHGC